MVMLPPKWVPGTRPVCEQNSAAQTAFKGVEIDFEGAMYAALFWPGFAINVGRWKADWMARLQHAASSGGVLGKRAVALNAGIAATFEVGVADRQGLSFASGRPRADRTPTTGA